jgi:hypothetical protein
MPVGTIKHENEIKLSIHSQINAFGREATSLFDIGRSFSHELMVET